MVQGRSTWQQGGKFHPALWPISALGQEFDVNEYIQLASAMSRIAARIGINRTARDALSLKEYITPPSHPSRSKRKPSRSTVTTGTEWNDPVHNRGTPD